MEPKHETIIEVTQEGEDTVTIPASLLLSMMSYHEELGTIKKERERRIQTSNKDFLAKVISAIDPISKKQTHEVVLTITADKWFEPRLIKQRYLVSRTEVSKKRR